ncbi:AAA family ATPase [Pigmentibacter sp. JX0631]|uniref:Lon protease family protein n=1 Tax=Pigmentibacter sp. JX0631 TaxID=2976982 RepID=UPI0024697FEB|nr:AAA family ATPase [Pigmentibacter sp. JX0631]WGL59533.1 AAA family ATPase [Pigmentibacter sp. JX0631]
MKKIKSTDTRTSLTQNLLAIREKEFPANFKIQKTSLLFRRLTTDEVYRSCEEKLVETEKLKKMEPNYDIISQVRAVRAINLGLGIQKPGYNIYVAGVQGTGKTSVIRTFLKKTAEKCSTPGDWIYVYNFKNPESPHAMELKTGIAKRFKKQMDELMEQLTVELVDAFQSEEYETNVNSTVNVSNEKKAKLFSELEKAAKAKNFGVKSTRMGIVTVPIVEGKPLSEKDYSDLNEEQKEKIESERNLLEPEVLDFARKVRAIENETKNKLEELQSELGDYVVSQALIPFLKEYEHEKNVLEYLDEVKNHLLENLNDFLPDDEDGEGEGEDTVAPSSYHLKKGDPHLPYRINVFVDNTEIKGAPIIIENNPTFYNLFGKIEKNIEYGVYTTDFKMIKAGSLARANGGYLVLNALDVLRAPHVWDTLKRVMKNQKLFIEDLGEQYSILATSGLRPEPIPLNVKIILIGSDWIYRMLYQHDEDFNKIFKIKADFDAQMDRSQKTIHDYVEFISTRTKVENLLPFDESGIAAIIEFGSRIVDDQDKLTTRFSLIKDITIEADYIAKEQKSKKVTRKDVEKAIEERYSRSSAIEDHIIEMLERKDIIISTNSRRVGEINGLAVYSLGDLSFGVPTRITCRTYKGKPGILNIEREASLSGKLHNKGVSILTSWINATFAKKQAAHIAATICFEQNYNGVDGDSATLAELCLVLSSIANIPIDQGIGVTGSVNQFGEIQPIGGVNEKIEGFFKTCKLQGLTGRQGCIIPVQNIKHLMLNRDVREAIEKEQFHIWPVAKVEEAFELLTGFTAGKWEEKKSQFEDGTAFHTIYKILHEKVKKTPSKRTTAKKSPPKKKVTRKK